jgi:hypothetical protein
MAQSKEQRVGNTYLAWTWGALFMQSNRSIFFDRFLCFMGGRPETTQNTFGMARTCANFMMDWWAFARGIATILLGGI